MTDIPSAYSMAMAFLRQQNGEHSKAPAPINQEDRDAFAAWVKSERSENHKGVFGRIKSDKDVEAVIRDGATELPPNASPQARYDWAMLHEGAKPERFKGIPYYQGDITKLSASDKLRVANGEPFPAPTSIREGLKRKGGPGNGK